ncbi:SpaH/EbpB family LPXTG-anchored major pilin [Lacticaseibacillus salsurivasis]|uniref:SpaH/EbpB family LPXTG-anchored major pilin n=1 Tax=Lacticaseibacillus salsurivasis TaxID=3081441 RepID=UPI0030C700B8
MNKSKQGKLIRMIGVCGLALGALTASGTVASIVQLGDAQSRVAVVKAENVTSATDNTSDRVLKLHKFKAKDNSMTNGTAATGTAADAAGTADLTPMAGVKFEVYSLDNAQAKAFAALDETAKAGFDEGTLKATIMTDASGNAEFNAGTGQAADGYYLVKELDNPAVQKKATPFIVHLPMTNGQFVDGASLQYTVDVYPKNEINEENLKTNPNKTLEAVDKDGNKIITKDTSVMAGQSVKWDLTAQRPADAKIDAVTGEDGKVITPAKYATQFVFSDPIDTKSLTLNEDNITMSIITDNGDGTTTPLALEEDVDFTVNTETTKGDYQVLILSLTPAGLEKLGDADAKSTVVATIETTVKDAKDTKDANILNTFDTYYTGTTTDEPGHETTVPTDPTDPTDPVDPTDPTDPTTPTNPDKPDPNQPMIYMGNVTVAKIKEKTDENATDEPLANATFKLAASEADAKAGTWVKGADGEAVTVTTDANGKAEFTGLLVDKVEHDDGSFTYEKKYYLVETDAPVGFDVDGKIHEVTATQNNDVDATVVDPDNFVPNLPLTGAQGRILILAVASVTLLGSGSYMILRKRREAND